MAEVRWAGWPACYSRPTANLGATGAQPAPVAPWKPGQRLKSTAVVFAPLITTASASPVSGW